MAFDPSGKFLFVCFVGLNWVVGYTLSEGTLEKCSEIELHEGAGPRHLAFNPIAPFAYVVNESDNSIVPLRYEAGTGTLSAVEDLPLMGRIRALADSTPGADTETELMSKTAGKPLPACL